MLEVLMNKDLISRAVVVNHHVIYLLNVFLIWLLRNTTEHKKSFTYYSLECNKIEFIKINFQNTTRQILQRKKRYHQVLILCSNTYCQNHRKNVFIWIWILSPISKLHCHEIYAHIYSTQGIITWWTIPITPWHGS